MTVGRSVRVGVVDGSIEELAVRFGVEFTADADDFDGYQVACRALEGMRVWLRVYDGAPHAAEVLVSGGQGDGRRLLAEQWPRLAAEVHEPSAPDVSGPVPSVADRWTLVRADDHGNTFLVGAFESEGEAQTARALLEDRGHKQLYEVRRPRTSTS